MNELPQLFGKNFLVGYVLPALLVLAVLATLTDIHGVTAFASVFGDFLRKDGLKDSSLPTLHLGLFALIVWATAALLLGLNYQLTQLLEGIGAANPAKLWAGLERGRFRKLLYRKLKHRNWQTAEAHAIHDEAARRLAAEFPEDESHLQPTRFGNTMSAAERYSQIVYLMEPMQTWMRLQSVMPDGHRDLVADSKASVDFWINLWFGGLLIVAAELALSILSSRPPAGAVEVAIGLGGLILALGAARAARSAATEFGDLVKATFDLYRDALAKQIGVELPRTLAKERELWTALSLMMLYRDGDAAADLARFRPALERQPRKPFQPSGPAGSPRPVRRTSP